MRFDGLDVSLPVGRQKVKMLALREGVWGLLPSRDRLLFNMSIRWLGHVRKAWALKVLGRIVDKLRLLWLTLKSRFIRLCLGMAGRIVEQQAACFKPYERRLHPLFRDAYLSWLRDVACNVDAAVYVAVQAFNENIGYMPRLEVG